MQETAPETAPAGSQQTIERRVIAALVLGLVSLIGLVFPPAIGFGIGAIVVSIRERKRIATGVGGLRGGWLLWVALVAGVIGCLLSLVIPGFVVYVWIYAIFHGGAFPPGFEG